MMKRVTRRFCTAFGSEKSVIDFKGVTTPLLSRVKRRKKNAVIAENVHLKMKNLSEDELVNWSLHFVSKSPNAWFHHPTTNVAFHIASSRTIISPKSALSLLGALAEAYPDFSSQWAKHPFMSSIPLAIKHLTESLVSNHHAHPLSPIDACSVCYYLACLGISDSHFFSFAISIISRSDLSSIPTDAKFDLLQACALNSFRIQPTFLQELFSSLKINFQSLPLEQRYYLAWLVCVLEQESCPQAAFVFETLSEPSEGISDFMKAKFYETWLSLGENAAFKPSSSVKEAYVQLSLENEDKNKHLTQVIEQAETEGGFKKRKKPTQQILQSLFHKLNITLLPNHYLESGVVIDFALPAFQAGIVMNHACDYCVDSSLLRGDARLKQLILEKQGWKIVSIPYWISPDRSVTRLRAHVRETLGEKLKVFLPLPSLDAFEEGKKLYLRAEKKQTTQENRKRAAVEISEKLNLAKAAAAPRIKVKRPAKPKVPKVKKPSVKLRELLLLLEECWGPFEAKVDKDDIEIKDGLVGETMKLLMTRAWHEKAAIIPSRIPTASIERKFEHVLASEKGKRF